MIDRVAAMNAARMKNIALREKFLQQIAEETTQSLNMDVNMSRTLCAVMFWCEGEKSTNSGVRFMNSDPVMMKLFVTSLRRGFDIDESKFRALLQLHEYHNESQQIQYWSRLTDIPISQFHKSYIKPNSGKNKRKDYPGCLSLRYGDSGLAKLLKMIYSNLGKDTGA